MKIYIWEGNGISSAYHDDGTLVVLANTVEEARQVVITDRKEIEHQKQARDNELNEAAFKAGGFTGEDAACYWRGSDESSMVAKMDEVDKKYPLAIADGLWDGKESALNREPDKIIEINKPCIVTFNGGGYD